MEFQKINLIIAEACDFEIGPDNNYDMVVKGQNQRVLLAIHALGRSEKDLLKIAASRVPNYYFDLNATHDAEKTLCKKDDQFRVRYYNNLNASFGCTSTGMWSCFASSQERAKHIVKTLGKWEEE